MAKEKIKIGIIGVGMVGTPLKRYFEERGGYRRGDNLFLYDTDPAKNYSDNINSADVIFICVPTPRTKSGAVGLEAVESAFGKISGGKIVVIKSTVPPGTTEHFQKKYPEHKLFFNPEFLTEVRAWENTLRPDRQLVGFTSVSRNAAGVVLKLLPPSPLSSPSENLELSATEAEVVKYAANVFLTRKVTFANAIFDIARRHGANYENIRMGVASDPRIGPSHLDVGHGGYRGYGGYCFIKDTDALIVHSRECGLERVAELFEADRSFNEKLLREQGLSMEDVSMHDHELVKGFVQNSEPAGE